MSEREYLVSRVNKALPPPATWHLPQEAVRALPRAVPKPQYVKVKPRAKKKLASGFAGAGPGSKPWATAGQPS